MYYTVEHNNNDYKIKVKYNDKTEKYSIIDILLVSGDREPTVDLVKEMESTYPEMIAEMGYADSLIEQKTKGY